MNYADKLSSLEVRMGYSFSNRQWLERALIHGSYGDGRRKEPDYERLEFLGDRVLGLLTAETLFKKSTDKEGGLARKLNALVRKESCAEIAEGLDIGPLIMMSKSTEKLGGRERVSILGDTTESILGAIYLDGGLEAARTFYERQWKHKLVKVLGQSHKDPKTELQERAAARKLEIPAYEIVNRTGPDHRPSFVVKVSLTDGQFGEGEGASKKEAERTAASNLLSKWKPS